MVVCQSHFASNNFPPAFWDELSKVWFTPRALRELDRRNNANKAKRKKDDSNKKVVKKKHQTAHRAQKITTRLLTQFAKDGGPDLANLRGCVHQKHEEDIISYNSIMAQQGHSDAGIPDGSYVVKRLSAYDSNFEQSLADNKIFLRRFGLGSDIDPPKPSNLNEIYQGLLARRPSLSPPLFDRSVFKRFQERNEIATSEVQVMMGIIPTILGDTEILNGANLRFVKLASMTAGATVFAVPDLYDGAYANSIHASIRRDLGCQIIPTNHYYAPVLPNFFLEVKTSRGSPDVVRRQAGHDGAYGARAMLSLQNYKIKDGPVYDGNAHAFSATYADATLKIFAHYVVAPSSTDGGGPEYHVIQLRSFCMADTLEVFIEGATAFRNVREMAQRSRIQFIKEANDRASSADS